MATKTPDLSQGLTGWIKPNGEFIQADDWYHEDAVYSLGLSYKDIMKEGWLHIGLVDGVYSYGEPTQAQLDVLWDIMMHPMCSPRLREYIQEYIEKPNIIE